MSTLLGCFPENKLCFLLTSGVPAPCKWLVYCMAMLDKCLEHILSAHLFQISLSSTHFCSQLTLSGQTLLPLGILPYTSKLGDIMPLYPWIAFYFVSEYLSKCHYIFIFNFWFQKKKISYLVKGKKYVFIMAYYFIA